MKAHKNTTDKNIMLLRISVFAFSFLMIPAFSYGLISFWVVSCAILLAVFFDKRLKEIIAHVEPIQTEGKRCKAVIIKYFLLVTELAIIVTIAPAVMMLLDFSALDEAAIRQEAILNLSPLLLAQSLDFYTITMGHQIMAVTNMMVVTFLIFTILLSFSKLWRIAGWILFPEVKGKDGERNYTLRSIFNYFTSYGLIWALFPIVIVALLIKENLNFQNLSFLELLSFSLIQLYTIFLTMVFCTLSILTIKK